MKKVVPVFPWPMHPVVAAQLAAIPDLLVVEARPGGPGPVLAINKLPTFACDAVLVKRPERLLEAVHAVISDGIEFVSMREWLGADDEHLQDRVSKVAFS